MFLNSFFRLTYLLSALLIASCTLANDLLIENTIVLDYKDFGPPDIAEDLLGPHYWQWDNGHYDSPQAFNIRVVIYRQVDLDDVKAMFPVSKNKQQDFRYVEYKKAILWYNKQITQFNADLSSGEGDINITFYFLRNLYESVLKIERTLRK